MRILGRTQLAKHFLPLQNVSDTAQVVLCSRQLPMFCYYLFKGTGDTHETLVLELRLTAA